MSDKAAPARKSGRELGVEQSTPIEPGAMPKLPERARNTLGEMVDLDGPIWRMRRNREGMGETLVSVGLLDAPRERGLETSPNAPLRQSMFHLDMTHTIRVFLAESLKRISPLGVKNRCRAFIHFERYLADTTGLAKDVGAFTFKDLTYDLLVAYTEHCESNTAAKGANPGVLRRFYRWGVQEKIAGFDRAVYRAMRGIRMKTSLRGHIARFRHPRLGAFTWEEQVQIDQRIREGGGDADGRAIVFLYQQLGLRPEAMALLRRRHLEAMPTLSGEEFFLNVPRVKKPGAVVAAEDCARWAINGRLGRLLLDLQPEHATDADGPLLPFLTERNPYNQIRQKLFKWADDVDLVTARLALDQQGWRDTRYARNKAPTMARLPLTAYRFRRTIATNLAEQGATIDEIAAFLDDKTTAMAAVYVENTSLITDTLAETLDRHPDWIKVITLFRGGVVKKDRDGLPEILGGAPHLADYDEFSDIGTIGYCASEDECRWEPPLSCYLCPFFRAVSRSRPHERQLAQIQREIDWNIGRESDRMAAIFRRNAAAIVQLLAQIAQSKGAMAKVLDRIKATRTRLAHPIQVAQPETKETPA